MRKILITNDDGIGADGIVRLADAASRFGEVWVVAPDGERSAASHSATFRHGVEVWETGFPVPGVRAFACTGTPADCVRIGVIKLIPGGADRVFSGINHGFNLACDIQYSATAGAAFEAAFRGIQAIAFSEAISDTHEVTDRYLGELIGEFIDKPAGPNRIWNVNFPGCALSECGGVLRGRTVSDDPFYLEDYAVTLLENGHSCYLVDGRRSHEASEGTDLKAIFDNFVSVGLVTNIS